MKNCLASRIPDRDVTFDVMKGIGILSVIIGHCFGGFIHSFVYTFHIPLFFILSGYFWKQRPIFEDIKKNACRLLLPVIFTQGIICLISLFVADNSIEIIPSFKESLEQLFFCSTGSRNSGVFWGGFSGIGKIWFLAALFWSKSIFNLLSVTKLGIWWNLFLCTILSLFAIVISNFINLPWCFLQGLSCIFFVSIGAVIKKYGFFTLPLESFKSIFCILAFLSWLCFVPYNRLDVYFFSWNSIPLINMIFAVIGTYFVFLFSQKIGNRFLIVSNVLSVLGYYSLVILSILSIKNMFPMPVSVSMNDAMTFASLLAWKSIVCVFLFVCYIRISFIKKIFKI